MMIALRSSLFIVCIFILYSTLANAQIVAKHSFAPPFVFGRLSTIPFWEYGGSAVATESFVRLVPAIRSRTGFLWNTEPVEFKSWEVEFEFRIHNTRSPGADGLAFWYAKTPKQTGTLLGNEESFEGLGIIFDTYDNDGQRDNPRVVGVLGPKSNWDFGTDFRNSQFASCQADFRNTENNVRVKVTYDKQLLQVMLDVTGTGNYVFCFSKDRIELPTGYHFGLTAMTGGLADYHDVMRFSTKDTSVAQLAEDSQLQGMGGRRRAGWWDPYEFYRKAQELEVQRHKLEEENKAAQALNSPVPAPVQQQETAKAAAPSTPSTPAAATTTAAAAAADTVKVNEIEKELADRYQRKAKQQQEQAPPVKQQKQQKQQPPQQQQKRRRILSSAVQDSQANDNSMVVLQTLEAITQHLKTSAQKGDVSGLTERLQAVSNSVSSIAREIQGFKGDLTQEISSSKQVTKQELDRVKETLKKLETKVDTALYRVEDVYKRVDEHSKHVGQVPSAIEQTMLKNQSSLGPWIYFILFQIVFAGGFIAWKRYSDLKQRDKFF